MEVTVKVEPLYINETRLNRQVVCRVTKFTGIPKPESRIMYFDCNAEQAEIEAEIAAQYDTADIQFQLCFYLPTYYELPF